MTNIAVAGIIGTDSLFQGNTDIVNVNLNNVVWIDDGMHYTFSDCPNLSKVTNFNENITYMIGTFSNCTNLVNVPSLPNNLIDMSESFVGCISLENAPVIPNSVTYMEASFAQCHNLVNAPVIPNSVVGLGSTFAVCESLMNAPVIPNNVQDMGSTFVGCVSLVNAPVIPNSVTLMSGTFTECSNLVNAPAIPNSVTNIEGIFDSCISLENAPAIPNSVDNMSWAFAACESLVNAPDMNNATNVSKMEGAFYGCVELTGDIYINSEFVRSASDCFVDTELEKNVYIPLEMTHQEILTKYCWERKGLIVYIDDDFYSQAYGQQSQIWYGGQVYDEYMNPFNGYLVWMPNYQAFVIYYSNAGQWGSYAIEYTPKGNISITKNIGDTSFTYDTFTALGYSTEERAEDGVMLFDINYVPGSVDLTDYDYNMDANNDVLLTNYKGIGKTNIVTPHV